MQIDYHYYAIYTLCRLAGITEDKSKIIAYSSQHTDDTKYGHKLRFKNGGRYSQIRSAHRFLTLKLIVKKKIWYNIFIPYHFLPGNMGEDFKEKLICRKNSEIVVEMLNDTLRTVNRSYGIHRLGVALHVYADTWSHDGFNGLMCNCNRVNDIRCDNEDCKLEDKSFEEQLTLIMEKTKNLLKKCADIIPPIGHAQAATYPDEPFMTWHYSDYWKKSVDRNNLDDVMDSIRYIYSFLEKDLHNRYDCIYDSEPKAWMEIESAFEEAFSFSGDSEEREKEWIRKLSSGFFGFTKDTKYDDREWFKKAVRVVKRKPLPNLYFHEKGFVDSDWRNLHKALKVHRDYVKDELLPKYELYI